MEIKVTMDDEIKAIDYCVAKLLRKDQPGGPWFYDSEDLVEEWMGDVFLEAVEYYLEGLGVTYTLIDEEEK